VSNCGHVHILALPFILESVKVDKPGLRIQATAAASFYVMECLMMMRRRRLLALYGLGRVRPKRSPAAWALCALSLMASSLAVNAVLPGVAAAVALDIPGTITTVAGTGVAVFSGDGGAATAATLDKPIGIAVDTAGNLFIADQYHSRVRRVSSTGVISTFAGTGVSGFSGDGGLAIAAQLADPHDLAFDTAGNLLISDTSNNRVRRVSSAGVITTFAGTGAAGFSGDGGPAINAGLTYPWGIGVDVAGNVFIADSDNGRIRSVSPSGIISTIAGASVCCASGEGGPATAAWVPVPRGIAVDAAGNVFFTDFYSRVRRISSSGIITTVAGTGAPGYSGDGGPAIAAQVASPRDVSVDASGNLFIADAGGVVRRVSSSGIITTVAGIANVVAGFSGDGGPATAAKLNNPSGVYVDAAGNLFIADTTNGRVRRVTAAPSARAVQSQNGSKAGGVEAGDPVTLWSGNLSGSWSDIGAPPGVWGAEWSRSYNSRDVKTGVLSVGWSTIADARLVLNANGSYSFHDQDGREVDFLVAAAGGFVRPEGLDATLSTNVTGPVLSWFSGAVWQFDTTGKLVSKTGWEGQSVAYTWTAGKLTTITSGTYSLTLTYTGTMLTKVAASSGRSVVYGLNTAANALASVTIDGRLVYTVTSGVAGRLDQLTDATGAILMLNGWDTSNRVISQSSSAGSPVTFGYNTSAVDRDVTTVTDTVTLAVATFEFDKGGRLLKATDPNGFVSGAQYDFAGNKTVANSRTATASSATYDGSGRPLTVTSADSGKVTVKYDTAGRMMSKTDGQGHVTSYGYDAAERAPSSTTMPDGTVSSADIVNGLLMSETDADGVKTTYTYDTQRRLSTVTDAYANTTSYTYNARGQVLTVTRPGNTPTTVAKTTNTYYPSGMLWTVTDPLLNVTTYTYDNADRLLTVTAPGNTPTSVAVTTNTYDAAGRLKTVLDPSGSLTTNVYDTAGRLWTVSKPGNTVGTFAVTTYEYDVMNRVKSVTDPIGRKTSYEYDAEDRLRKTIDASTPPTVTETVYDTAGRVWKEIDGIGRVRETHYDALGRVDWVKDPAGQSTTMGYDANSRVNQVTDVRGGVTGSTFTLAGRPKTSTAPTGVVTTNTYDLAGRLWKVTRPTGDLVSPTADTITTYDRASRVETTTSPGGLATLVTYDLAGQVLTSKDPAGVVTTNTWSKRGELLTTKKTDAGTTTNTYNPDGTLATVTDPTLGVTSFGYDGRKNRISRTNGYTPAGVDTWGYDLADQLKSSKDALGRETLTDYDAAGRLKIVTDPSLRTVNYGYDLAGQNTTKTVTNGAAYVYDYDSLGRRYKVTTGGQAWTSTWAPGNVLTSRTDPAGRTTSWNYDTPGRLSGMTYPDGSTVKYAYDAVSRVASIQPGEVMADSFTDVNGTPANSDRWSVSTTPSVLYADAMVWENWSFAATLNVAAVAPAPVHSGTNSISVTYTAAGGGASFRTATPVPALPGQGVSFWAYGGTGGNTILINVNPTDTAPAPGAKTVTIPAGVWTQVNASWAELGNPATIGKINLIGATAAIQPAYWIDDLQIGPAPTVLYGDTLAWDDYSFFATLIVAAVAPAPVHSGTNSIAVTYTASGGGAAFHTATPITANPGGGVSFWAYGGTGGDTILVGIQPNDTAPSSGSKTVTIPAGVWTQINATWAELGNPATVGEINLISATTAIQPAYWIDDLIITGPTGPAPVVNSNKLTIAGPNALANLDLTSRVPTSADNDVTLTYNATDITAVNRSDLVISARKTATGEYRVTLPSNGGTATVGKKVAGVLTTIATFAIPGTGARKVRFQTQGTNVRTRVWQAPDPEPATWINAVVDTTVTGLGAVGFSVNRVAGANTVTVDDWSQTDPTNAPAAMASYKYNLDSQYTEETLNGGKRILTYTTGRLTNYAETLGTTTTTTGLTYDTSGRIKTEATTGAVAKTYGYDLADQLTTITPATGTATTYTYDKLGRRINTAVGTTNTINTYDAASQLKTSGTTTYGYDTAGRRTTETAGTTLTTYTYDPQGRLATTVRGGTTVTRGYDPDDNLTSVTNGTSVTGIDWDTNTGAPQPTIVGGKRDVHGIAGWITQRAGVTDKNFSRDIYGSVTAPVATARATSYDQFGKPAGLDTWIPTLGYRGELTIDSLTYLRARNYDAANSVFTSRDPLDGIDGTPVVGNAYQYGNNNPLMNTDPFGLSTTTTALGKYGRGLSLAILPAEVGSWEDSTNSSVVVLDDLAAIPPVPSSWHSPRSADIVKVAGEVGVNWNLLASIEQYESKSLTNTPGGEYINSTIDALKQIRTTKTSVGLMQLQLQAAKVALAEAPWIAKKTGYYWLDPDKHAQNIWDESGFDKNLSLYLGAAYLKVQERTVRGGLSDRRIEMTKSRGSTPAGSTMVYLSSLAAQAYNGGSTRALAPFFDGRLNTARLGGEYYTYGLVATERMQNRVGYDDRRGR
jgi:RHS repeat-associated protein